MEAAAARSIPINLPSIASSFISSGQRRGGDHSTIITPSSNDTGDAQRVGTNEPSIGPRMRPPSIEIQKEEAHNGKYIMKVHRRHRDDGSEDRGWYTMAGSSWSCLIDIDIILRDTRKKQRRAQQHVEASYGMRSRQTQPARKRRHILARAG